ncbi:MAG: DapH/DapD/GlmU-related protein [Verrucomicrobiota bacterium JB023]|nr:DapH/DapD/GlmU-related protein [Verrucomicrobiota bacterium JB023]
MKDFKTYSQDTPYDSPWTKREQILMLVWEWVWMLACAWTPKPCNKWRIMILRLFGARIEGRPFVHQRARIQIPWNLILHDHACLGDRATAYSLGVIEIHEGATVAQEAYLCTGTHDFSLTSLPLQTAPISIGAKAFIGVRALILPGVTIGREAIVGAGSLVTKDVEDGLIVAGNPAKTIRRRPQEQTDS